MKFLKIFDSRHKLIIRIKYALFGLILMGMSCGYENCTSDDTATGVGCNGNPPPPPPVFIITYEQQNNNKTKFFFNTNEDVLLNKIETMLDSAAIETINFGYPYLISKAYSTHIIKDYNNSLPQQRWTFTFTGISQTTGNSFTTSGEIVYQ